MSLNFSEIDKVLSELPLAGSFIQKIYQTDYQNLFFQVYTPGEAYTLHICVAPGETRICRTNRRGGKMKKPPRFTEFLRARLKGARLLDVRQINGDRIIRFDIRKGDEESILWVRLWGNAANVIVTDTTGLILEAQYRRPGKDEVNGGRFMLEEDSEPGGCSSEKYPVREFEGSSFNDYIDRVYSDENRQKRMENLRRQALAEVEKKQNYYELLLGNLQKRQEEFKGSEHWKQWGDLLMSEMHNITRGSSGVEISNFYNGGRLETIPLDRKKSAYENAQAYYTRHKKSQRGLSLLGDEIENAGKQLEYWGLSRQKIEQTEDLHELKQLLPDREVRTKSEITMPGLQYMSDGFLILVGRTAKENDELLRRYVKGNDYWIHTRDTPGGYVFIRGKKGKSIPLETLLDAGNLALHYSKARSGGEADMYYTQVKYLRRPKEGKKGLVLPTQEKNLHIKHDEQRLQRLMGTGK